MFNENSVASRTVSFSIVSQEALMKILYRSLPSSHRESTQACSKCFGTNLNLVTVAFNIVVTGSVDVMVTSVVIVVVVNDTLIFCLSSAD